MARGTYNPPAAWQPPRSSAKPASWRPPPPGPPVPEKGKIVGSTRAVGKRKTLKGRAVGKGKSVKRGRVDSDEDEKPYERIKNRPEHRCRYFYPEEISYDDLSGEELEPDFQAKYYPFVHQGQITSKEYYDRITRSKSFQRFAMQVNLTQGFDVEQLVPPTQHPTVIPWTYLKDRSKESFQKVFALAELAIRRYNGRFRKSYKVVDVVKWNEGKIMPHKVYYITFNVKKEGKDSGPPRTFQAEVGVHVVTKEPLVDLCRPRPAKKGDSSTLEGRE